jgi:hypothetical protein
MAKDPVRFWRRWWPGGRARRLARLPSPAHLPRIDFDESLENVEILSPEEAYLRLEKLSHELLHISAEEAIERATKGTLGDSLPAAIVGSWVNLARAPGEVEPA